MLKTENKLFMIPKYRKSSYISAKNVLGRPMKEQIVHRQSNPKDNKHEKLLKFDDREIQIKITMK